MTTGIEDGPRLFLLRQRPFACIWLARMAMTVAYHILAVSIGWQLYTMTGSAFDLGLIGLMQFLPIIPLTLGVGLLADRIDRRAIVSVCAVVTGAAAALFCAGTAGGWLERNTILAIVLMVGIARTFEQPTLTALMPAVVGRKALPQATALWASANQTAQIVGPALGGLLYGVSALLAYASSAALFMVASVLVLMVQVAPVERKAAPISVLSLFSGFAFVRAKPIILGCLSLDLLAVLFGAVLALLPVFAKDILHTDSTGFGLLRSAPALGALCTSLLLAYFPLRNRFGPILFAAVAGYGAATIVFGLSTHLYVSMAALALVGVADVVSVVIRITLVQLQTPDDLRGRVSSVFSMFTGTSNQLGEFRAGVVAAAIGAVPAVLIGGVSTLAIATLWMLLFPDLRRIRRLDR